MTKLLLMNVLRTAWRVLRAVLLAVAWLWFLFEEWGWHPLAAWLGRLARWAPLARLEARIAGLPPRLALIVFLVPVVALLPVKLLALALLHGGHGALGLAVIVAAKLVGTAIGGRLYVLTEPQLMQMPRFARVVRWWRAVRANVRRALHAALPRGDVRVWLRHWRRRLRSWLGAPHH